MFSGVIFCFLQQLHIFAISVAGSGIYSECMNSRSSKILAFALLVSVGADGHAGGFRCGTKLVVTGDSISRLINACGQPELKYKAKETVGSGSNRTSAGVTNWIYSRDRKRNMVVSIRGGKVVKIATE